MARDGSGNYTLPAGQPVSTGTTISSTVHNTLASDIGSALTQSISKDGQTTPTANLPMGGFKHTGVADGTSGNHYATVGQLQTSAASLAASVAGTDTITATLNPAITTYTSGMFVSFIAANSNATTTPTIALNGLAAKTIVRPGGNALSAADMVATKLVHMEYDGTNFVLLNPATGTYPALIPTGSTVPANGMYLSAANTVAWATASTLRGSVNSTGNWVLAAPSSGTTLSVAPLASGTTIDMQGAQGSGSFINMNNTHGSDGRCVIAFQATFGSTKQYTIGVDPDGGSSKSFAIRDITGGRIPFTIGTAGNVSIAAPSSGTTLAVTAKAADTAFSFTDGTVSGRLDTSGGMSWGTSSAHLLGLFTNNTTRVSIASAGNVTINAPSSGTTLAMTQASGGISWSATDGTSSAYFYNNGAGGAVVGTSSSHPFSIVTGGSIRIGAAAAGNVTINAPSSGTAATINGLSGANTFVLGSTGAASTLNTAWNVLLGSNSWSMFTQSTDPLHIGSNGAAETSIYTNNTARMVVASAGNVTINAPSSGVTQTLTATAGGIPLQMGDGTVTTQHIFTSSRYAFGTTTNHESRWFTNSVDRIQITGAGNVTINAPSSGVALAVAGVSGTHSATIADAAATSGFKVGYLNIPQNAQTGNYTLVLADAGKHIYHAAGAGAGDIYTIPANASVAYDIGTTVTFVNRDTTNAVSIAITTDTLTLAGAGTTGTRTLAAYGIATAIKVTSTEWMISGTGLT